MLNFFAVVVVTFLFTVQTLDSYKLIVLAQMYFSKLLKVKDHSKTAEKQ
jgi:hypothetical protein